MASADVVNLIVDFTLSALTYLLPVIGVMAGITFIVSFLFAITIGLGRRTFRG